MARESGPLAHKESSWSKLLGGFWRLSKPYWSSEERASAWGLLVLIIALTLGSVYLAVQFNTWNQLFYDAVQKFDATAFWRLILRFCILAVFYVTAAVVADYSTLVLQNRWRRWMTKRLLRDWLSDKSHYLWQLSGQNTDNPDQRISDDVNDFSNQSLVLSVGLLRKMVTLVSFVGILWKLSGPLVLGLDPWHAVSIPGYMAWGCLVYAILGTWLSHRIGKPLIALNYRQQRREADFRYSLVRLRENGESVALSDGEGTEQKNLGATFQWVYSNFSDLVRKQMHLNFFGSGYEQAAIVFPMLLAAPRYFSKLLGLGILFQVIDGFGQVNDAMSWVVDKYSDLAAWRSVVERLVDFDAEVLLTKQLRLQALSHVASGQADAGISLQGLSLSLPGQAQALAGPMSMEFKPRQSVLIAGPSGAGKSTLLRVIGGIWPYASGKVTLPQASILLLPQNPYLPVGSLRAAMAYPSAADAFSREALERVLGLCRLEHLKDRLETQDNWSLILSVGEQQRVAWTRVFLHKPQWLLLDEATSALDEATQERIYAALKAELPATTVISVAHTQNPQAQYGERWDFGSNHLAKA